MLNERDYRYTVHLDWAYPDHGEIHEWVYQSFGMSGEHYQTQATANSLDWRFRKAEHAFWMTLRFHDALLRDELGNNV